MNKHIKKTIVVAVSFIMVANKVYGRGINSNATINTDTGDTTGGTPQDYFVDWTGGSGTNGAEKYYRGTGSDSNKAYRYRYQQTISIDSDIKINAYNMNGESVIPYDNSEIPKFKAGTWIGINTTEIQSASWKVWDFQFQEVRKNYTCEYAGKTTWEQKVFLVGSAANCRGGKFIPHKNVSRGSCIKYVKHTIGGITQEAPNRDYYEDYKCPETFGGRQLLKQTSTDSFVSSSGGSIANELKNKAYEKAQSEARDAVGNPISKVEYLKNNKFQSEKARKWEIIKGTSNGIKYTGGKDWGTYTAEYKYTPEKVCMNLKTSEVLYNEECIINENKGIVEIKNNTTYDKYLNKTIEYWHYFIPLDTKSNNVFPIKITGNDDRPLSLNECRAIMKEPNYINYIAPKNGTFTGDYPKLKNNSSDWKLLNAGKGCEFTTIVNFPIEQKFYHEEKQDNAIQFKGFEFYYRPININNPFPNGIKNDSLWNEWQNSKEQKPDLKDSFNEITYIAQDINAKKVRKYTEENPYTDWDKMNIDGKSSYIGDEIIRKSADKVYKLGCGPLNTDWEECK